MLFVRPALRVPMGVALAVALGALATLVSGEYLFSWSFLLIDVPLVAGAELVGFAVARASGRLGERHPGGP